MNRVAFTIQRRTAVLAIRAMRTRVLELGRLMGAFAYDYSKTPREQEASYQALNTEALQLQWSMDDMAASLGYLNSDNMGDEA